MAIHTRWQLHCPFSLDGWEQIDFTLDTLPWVSTLFKKKILVKLVGKCTYSYRLNLCMLLIVTGSM